MQHNTKVGSKIEMENMSLILLLAVQKFLVYVWNTDMRVCICTLFYQLVQTFIIEAIAAVVLPVTDLDL